ncbi:MAG: AAA family ATPase, partial [Mycobacterium sp.]|uniref:ATP-binding protein n=1 Tax=Mycobacterium sp. TaxID=1785 RepID=UPI003BB0E19C
MGALLERESVLAELEHCLRSAARGAGRVVLLRGEAGVGKTAVIRRFVGGLGQQMRVLPGWCDPLAAPRPLGPLLDALAALSGAQAAAVSQAIDRGDSEGVYASVLRLLADTTSGWVWVIEDAHWADGGTLDLLRFVARRVASLPVLLLVSYRDDELGEQHPLAAVLGDLATIAAVSRIGLARLSPEAVAMLATGSGINAEALHRLTDGNPFYVTEVLAAGADATGGGGLPRSVSEAVWGRLARLSAPARDFAHAAAVCGPRASLALVQTVCPAPQAALTECLDAGMLVLDADVVGFRHELARRATLERVSDYQRRLLHQRALVALSQPPVSPDTLAALVFHAEEAGDTDAVIRYGPAAAERAAALGAHREAAELYGVTLRHAEATPKQQKVVWLEQHAFESYLCGHAEIAARSWRQAITLRHDLGDRLAEGDNLRWFSQMVYALGRVTEARQADLASLRLLEGLAPSAQLAWSLVHLAELCAFTYDPAGDGYAARAVTLATRLGEEVVVRRARGYAAMTTVFRTDAGWEDLEAVWRDAMAADAMVEYAGITGAIICRTAALHHDLDRADRYIAESTAFCGDRDLVAFQMFVAGDDAQVGLHRGDWSRAGAAAHDVLTRAGLSPLHRTMPLVTAALLRARRGEQPVAPLLDEALTA